MENLPPVNLDVLALGFCTFFPFLLRRSEDRKNKSCLMLPLEFLN